MDLLVSIVIVGILVSLLLPALGMVREMADRVVCQSNLRQIGLGTTMYAQNNDDAVMNSVKVSRDPSQDQSFDTVTLRLNEPAKGWANRWDGVGILFRDQYLPAPKLFYCPSHKGPVRFSDYAEQWAGDTGEIVGNYQYRALAPASSGVMASNLSATPMLRMTRFLSGMDPTAALTTDSLRSQEEFSHKVGANVLRVGMEVDWFADSGMELFNSLPMTRESASGATVQQAWLQLDAIDRQ